MKTLIKIVLTGLAILVIHVIGTMVYQQQKYAPPDSVSDVSSLIDWMGEPRWISRYSDGASVYYELGKDESAWVIALTLASSSPSYTVDETGQLVGWSPDSGDVKSPEVLRELSSSRESMPVEVFMALFEE